MMASRLDISVVICAYTEDRWQELLAAVESVKNQTLKPREIIVVIDHNSSLYQRVLRAVAEVVVIENRQPQGLSGARNSGVAVAQGSLIAFMDEDAVAAPDCLAQLFQGFKDPKVLGVGGASLPIWAKSKPQWLPEEFFWVVGCSYKGTPQSTAPVRNLIGCNMAFRRKVFEEAGGFRIGMGRIGVNPVGCEETELCIRAGQHWKDGLFLYKPSAVVFHRVPEKRTGLRYFLNRCYSEGISKAMVSSFVGAGDGLASERQYTLRTLPQGVIQGITDAVSKRSLSGLARSAAIIAGLATTCVGYVRGKVAFHSLKNNTDPLIPEKSSFTPMRLIEIELSHPPQDISPIDPKTGRAYSLGLACILLHHQPLGTVELELGKSGLAASDAVRQIWQALGPQIKQHLTNDGIDATSASDMEEIPSFSVPACLQEIDLSLSNLPLVSVVICTRDRIESIAICLDSFRALDYPNYEIILVDNAPATNTTFELVESSFNDLANLRYVREDRPGLSAARNRGLAEAKGDIVAFTDDDVKVDSHWLKRLVQGFSLSDNVACVTGLVVPAEIETPAQAMMEQFGGMGKGFNQHIFDLNDHRLMLPIFPYSAGRFGVGANMAYKTSVLRGLNGFDPALGTGTRACGGEDLAMFFNIITHGYQLVYLPGAFVYHYHRRTYVAFQKQAYAYGIGLTAYLTKIILDRPSLLLDIAVRIPAGAWYLLNGNSQKNNKKQENYPAEIDRLERKGMLYGPLAYLRSRRQVSFYEREHIHVTKPSDALPIREEASQQ